VFAGARLTFHSEFYKIKVKDDINALPNPEAPNFRARYKRVSKACFWKSYFVLLSLRGSCRN
jgi:hypothetical protein